MDTEILIPKLSVLKIYKDMYNYGASCFYGIPDYKDYVSSQQNSQGFSFSAIIQTIQSTLLSSTRQDSYDILNDDTTFDIVLPKRLMTELREKKRTLLNCMHKHELALKNLRNARLKCLKSKQKLELYTTSLQAQQHSLVANINNNNKCKKALNKTEIKSDQCIQQHKRNQAHFETLWLREISLREVIEKLSRDLEKQIKERMCEVLLRYVDSYNVDYSYDEIEFIAEKYYEKACRKYKFQTTQNEPCSEDIINKPVYTERRTGSEFFRFKDKILGV